MTTASSPQSKRCNQCWRILALDRFEGRLAGKVYQDCADCRSRMRGWAGKSVAEKIAAHRPMPREGHDRVHFALRSNNRKTGHIPVSTTAGGSCPTSCSFRDKGCYAELGKTRIRWTSVHLSGLAWEDFCRCVEQLPAGQLWRHNEAGDLPGTGDHVDAKALAMLVAANAGRRGFTYTHKPVLRDAGNRDAIASANRNGFTINLSADTLGGADALAELGIAPVVVVLPDDAPPRLTTAAGRAVMVCPAQRTPGVTCASCGICQHPRRDLIVGFRAHGQSAAIVSEIVRSQRVA